MNFDLSNIDNRFPWEDENGDAPFSPPDSCRGCGGALLPENRRIADCCPCNAPRGVNHGLVPKNTCTCDVCDPAQTGSTRVPSISQEDKNKLLLINVSEIQDLLDGTEESGDIEHQIQYHSDNIPQLLRTYATVIERIKERCSAQVWKMIDADGKFYQKN